MSNDSTTSADIANLEMDLSQLFRPSWTVASEGQSESTSRLAAKFDSGDRPDRGGRGPSRDRDARGPRRDSQEGGPRSGSGRGSREGGGPRPGNRDRGDQRDARRPRESRPEPQPALMLEGWKLELTPEPLAVEAISKQIRSRSKAYPLFELARLIIRVSERYSVQLQAESENTTPLFRVKRDGSLWTSHKEAVDHLLTKHLSSFYRAATITTDPPKGSYSVVAECGMSGTLLGPPNHHAYQSRLLALHAARFKNVPFEVYKTRIRMSRDEALMERWKTDQSTKTVYFPVELGAPETSQEILPTPEAGSLSQSETAGEILDAVTTTEIGAESSESATSPESVESEPLPSDEVESDGSSPSDNETTGESEETAAGTASGEGSLSSEQIAAHFRENHAETELESVQGKVVIQGHTALHGSTPLLREFLLANLRELDRFPLQVAHLVSKELSNLGLQLFKAQEKKIVHVSMARPKYLDRATTPIAPGFGAIMEYLEAHPKQHRDKQWSGLLAQRTESADTEEETLKRREQALGSDLLWLLHQGHVIDFAMGNLRAAHPPKPQQQKESKKGSTPETPTQERQTSTPDEVKPVAEAPATPTEEVTVSISEKDKSAASSELSTLPTKQTESHLAEFPEALQDGPTPHAE